MIIVGVFLLPRTLFGEVNDPYVNPFEIFLALSNSFEIFEITIF